MKLLRRPLMLKEHFGATEIINGWQVVDIYKKRFYITLFQEKLLKD